MTLARIGSPRLFPGWRLASLIGGLAALWLVVGSPLGELDHHSLTAHMVQHLVLMVVAAPLLLLGASQFIRDRSEPFLRSRLAPALCWLAGTMTVMVWHIPAVFDLAQRSHPWHEGERACFLAAGLLFWSPVILSWRPGAGPPRWSIPLYLFLATLPCDALSAFLTFCDHVVYRAYGSTHGAFRIDPLQDQAFAGALMWVTVTFAYLIPAIAVTIQILSGPSRHTSDVEVFERVRIGRL